MTGWLQLRQISKRFHAVQALRAVDLDLRAGEVLALVGENGAGKSSLMKILAGAEQPTSGTISIDGQTTTIDSVQSALKHGIALIHQELNLLANLDIGTNLFLGREPIRFGLVNRRQIRTRSRKLLERVGLDLNPKILVGQLTIGQQQLVEIARALSVEARVIIMDEPTSSLSQGEVETLFRVVRELQHSGISVIYISHRLAEVQELADRVMVLRDGQLAGELARSEIHHDRLVQMMVGRDLSRFYSRTQHPLGSVALQVEDLRTTAWPKHSISFSVRAGEIVGIAGLVGAGRSELLRAIFSIDRALSGYIAVDGQPCMMGSPRTAILSGLALVPEDRKTEGLILENSVFENIGLAGWRRFAHAGWLVNRTKTASDTVDMIDRLSIKTPSPHQPVQYLSGGNQQKVVLGKWLTLQPKVLLLDEPTRGIDIGAKQEIYSLMERLASQGMAILFVSSELEEILGMSDRVMVMCEGALTGQLTKAQMSEQAVMQLATRRGQHVTTEMVIQ